MAKWPVAGALTIQVESRVNMGTAQTRNTVLQAQSPSRASGQNALFQRWPQIVQMIDEDDTETKIFIPETAGGGGDA